MDEPTGSAPGSEPQVPAPEAQANPPAQPQPAAASALPPLPPYAAPTFSYTPPPPRRRRVWPWVVFGGGLFIGLCAVYFVFMVFAMRSITGSSGGFDSIGSNIAVIDIDGEISSADTLVDQLRKFDQDDSVKAIILHIDSPGGGAAASQEIYHEVLHIRDEKNKPIVASIESVGASGAYYVASATNKIYANQASVVGSIGVIMEWTNYGDLLTWAKLKPEVIHAGTLKDAGDPSRAMTPEERVYFQSLVDNMYAQFVADVSAGRHLPPDQIKALATGQVWTGQQALPLHLIDETGGFRQALLETAKSVGISGEPSVVRPTVYRRTFWDLFSSDAGDLFSNPGKLLEKHAGFYFLWR
ncbi:MAG TPA: signal peptide peptidase SppA [Acidobacteriaceae bacterium]|jgi:protease-4|nr:signal peptide peptidase SppA [Acidobacteriaceae bacterium]